MGKTKENAGRKEAESGRRRGTACFACRSRTCGDAQINGDGLI